MTKVALSGLFLVCLTLAILLGQRHAQMGQHQVAHTGSGRASPVRCFGKSACRGKSSWLANISILQKSGARPSFSPSGKVIVFDRQDGDGFFHLYLSDLRGKILRGLTGGKAGGPRRSSGYGTFDPTGKYVVFNAEQGQHFGMQMKFLSDPGLGTYFNLWATDISGKHFWQLTNIPIKRSLFDRVPSMGIVHPLFSPDGKKLIWTERYRDNGYQHCNNNWGYWRLMQGDWRVKNGAPSLVNQTVLYTPTVGNYVTAMGFLDSHTLLVAGNLSGQHVYGMDQYTYNLTTHKLVDLTNTPDYWEEDSSIDPKGGTIVFMSNQASRYKLDFCNPDWAQQPRERDYWMMDRSGSHKQRLSYFNDSSAPEYVGKRVIVAASTFSPDGRYLAATLGIDNGTATKSDIKLEIVLLDLQQPPRKTAQHAHA